MSSTRYSQQPLQIYQDPVTSFDHAPMPSSKNATIQQSISPLRPIKNAASRRNIIFNPPQNGPSKQSPLKVGHLSSSPSRAPFGNKLNAISMPPPRGSTSNTDSMEKRQPLMSKFKTQAPQKALFNTFSNPGDKENYPQQQQSYYVPPAPTYDGLPQSNFSLEGLYPQKPPQKRLMEAAPIHEARSFKKAKVEEAPTPLPPSQTVEENVENPTLPAPESFPPLVDDGTKPPHSYAQLIGMSILRASNRRLTLAQIYKWISDTYSFYGASDAGWQNSIRHNLSLNKAFIKQERPKDDPGKGNYWAIEPGMEAQFIKEKTSSRKPPPSETIISALTPTPALPSLPTPQLLDFPHSAVFKPLAAAPQQELPLSKPAYAPPEPQLPTKKDNEPSSDATIPASDTFVEGEQDDGAPSSPSMRSSSPPAAIHSSPPVPRHVSRRSDTPPPVPRYPFSSANRSSHKRKFASMDDSGYFSSLDSSALRRPNGLIGSEAGRPRIKRGRAEEEIARLRGSSYDSPTKRPTSFGPVSSSPLRQNVAKKNSQMLPPLTPAVTLRAPLRPPPSISPNTNLRMHRDKVREMVGSPLRGVTSMDENSLPWSPAFNLDDTSYLFHHYTSADELDVSIDNHFLSVPGNGSPGKRSAKRPRLDRSRSSNILSDISNHNFKTITSTPSLKLTPSLQPGFSLFNSPSKGLGLMESPSKLLNLSSPTKIPSPNFVLDSFDLPNDDFFGEEFLADEMDEFAGMDIMQGFQKIGANGGGPKGTTPKPNGRLGLPRSFSSRF